MTVGCWGWMILGFRHVVSSPAFTAQAVCLQVSPRRGSAQNPCVESHYRWWHLCQMMCGCWTLQLLSCLWKVSLFNLLWFDSLRAFYRLGVVSFCSRYFLVWCWGGPLIFGLSVFNQEGQVSFCRLAAIAWSFKAWELQLFRMAESGGQMTVWCEDSWR